MEILTLFVLGISIGSFINVCIYRLPQRITLFSRSVCPVCKRNLFWYELVPIISFVLLCGRCYECHSKITIQYPLIEVLTGILTVVILFTAGISWVTVLQLVFIYGMFVIAAIDWKHLIIPDEVIFVLGGVGLFYTIALEQQLLGEKLFSGIIGFTVLYVIKFLGDKIFKKETMGFGDIKLAGLLGFYLGWELLLFVVWTSSIIATIFGAFLVLVFSKMRDTKLPFGSMLAVTSSIIIIFKTEIEYWLIEWIVKTQYQ